MKVALVGQYSETGGAGTLLRRQAKLLAEAGVDVNVFSNDDCFHPSGRVRGHHVPEFHILGRSEHGPFVRQIVGITPSVVHFHMVTALRNTSLVKEIARNCPTVITPHSHFFTCPSVKKVRRRPLGPCSHIISPACFVHAYAHGCNARWPRRAITSYMRCLANQRMARAVDALIVTCGQMANLLAAAGLPERSIHVVPPAVEVPPIIAGSLPRRNLVLFAGRLDAEKGAGHLLDITQRVTGEHELWIAGDGPLGGELAAQITERGMQARVKLLGWLTPEELKLAFERSSVVIMPSVCPETYGLSGAEALAHGCPVVAFDVGAISTWLDDGVNGFLVPVGDWAGLARRVELLLRERGLASAMGHRGRAAAKANNGAERHLARLLSAYEAAIEFHRAR